MAYKIFQGWDHVQNRPLYQVVGVDNDYVGEWCLNFSEAVKEFQDLEHRTL